MVCRNVQVALPKAAASGGHSDPDELRITDEGDSSLTGGGASMVMVAAVAVPPTAVFLDASLTRSAQSRTFIHTLQPSMVNSSCAATVIYLCQELGLRDDKSLIKTVCVCVVPTTIFIHLPLPIYHYQCTGNWPLMLHTALPLWMSSSWVVVEEPPLHPSFPCP